MRKSLEWGQAVVVTVVVRGGIAALVAARVSRGVSRQDTDVRHRSILLSQAAALRITAACKGTSTLHTRWSCAFKILLKKKCVLCHLKLLRNMQCRNEPTNHHTPKKKKTLINFCPTDRFKVRQYFQGPALTLMQYF